MKRWALLVVFLYALLLVLLAAPAIWLAFWPELSWEQALDAYDLPSLAILLTVGWATVLALAEACLLVVPVRLGGGRPIRRRHVFWTMLGAFVLLLVMVVTMCGCLYETLGNSQGWLKEPPTYLAACVGVGLLWAVWAAAFVCYVVSSDMDSLVSRTMKFLLAGSILELLVAVPTHVLARHRNYCCAGFGTFWGLAAGISVMLAAFGPAVLLLYVKRYRQLRGFPVKLVQPPS